MKEKYQIRWEKTNTVTTDYKPLVSFGTKLNDKLMSIGVDIVILEGLQINKALRKT